MIAQQTHIIKQQTLDLQLSSKHNAFEMQTEFRELFLQKLLPILSDYFDSVIPENVTLTADRLEVDLGEVDFSKMDDYSVNIIADKMKASLSKQLPKESPVVGQTSIPTKWRNISLLLFFLQTGHLPWWQKKLDFRQFEGELLLTLKTIPISISTQLKSFLERALFTTGAEKTSFKRLVFQFSDHFISELIAAAFATKHKGQPQSRKTTDRVEYWQEVTLDLLNLSKADTVNQPKSDSGKKPLDHSGNQLDKQREAVSDKAIKNKSLDLSEDDRTKESKHVEHQPFVKQEKEARAEESDTPTAIRDESEISPNQSRKTAGAEESILTDQKIPNADGYYIHNSGLVLIAPYLGHFFTELKLLEDQNFVDEEAKIRAMHLLQYLTSFEEEAPEYDLLLNKILCGISLEKPVLKSVQLTEQEKQEARQLLEAVIRNWPALKSTSPEGLQEGFLRREGKLIQKKASGNWLLQVEGKAHDILLGKLPWTYSMIKQSWMPTMLTVEWL